MDGHWVRETQKQREEEIEEETVKKKGYLQLWLLQL